VNRSGIDAMLGAIISEAEQRLQQTVWAESSFDSLYLGGGTPSMVEPEKLLDFLNRIKKLFPVKPNAEITLEVNPDDVNEQAIACWKLAGVNRVSIGVQDFDDVRLQWMNRNHGSEQAHQAIEMLQAARFPSLNIDLIYGIPGMDENSWVRNLEIVFQSRADHLSAYALTLEARTPYAKLVQQGRYEVPEEKLQAAHFGVLMDAANASGWHHYEISNLCRPGFEAKHNSAYWRNEPYLGLGPSAHSYDGKSRYWNPSDNKTYVQMAQAGIWENDGEDLTAAELLNELVMTRMRMSEGLNLLEAEALHPGWLKEAGHEIGRLVDLGWAVKTGDALQLTRQGRFYADAIASALMVVDLNG